MNFPLENIDICHLVPFSARMAGENRGVQMGIRNKKVEEIQRLEEKTLASQFLNQVKEGLGCSRFEAEAVLGVVHEVYGPYLGQRPTKMTPGYISLVCVDSNEPAGKPISECQKCSVQVRVHRGKEDDQCLQEAGPIQFRRDRIADVCQEAFSQGGLLTREDLAYRIFFVSPRTISRDLQWLRENRPETPIPLRSNVHDIGPVLTHREQIILHALKGKTTSEICEVMHHSAEAVSNYIGTFSRCVFLSRQGLHASQIAYLLGHGRTLIERYLEIVQECEMDPNKAFHLEELVRPATPAIEKKATIEV
jgi:hypothetical protein